MEWKDEHDFKSKCLTSGSRGARGPCPPGPEKYKLRMAIFHTYAIYFWKYFQPRFTWHPFFLFPSKNRLQKAVYCPHQHFFHKYTTINSNKINFFYENFIIFIEIPQQYRIILVLWSIRPNCLPIVIFYHWKWTTLGLYLLQVI